MGIGGEFDPQYFRETRPRWSGVGDEDCRAAWLTDPDAAGPGAPGEHLARLNLDLPAYPESFPWRYYARLHPAAGAHRWKALEHFVQRGFAAGPSVPFGPEAKTFLISLARGYSVRADRLAIKAFQLAAAFSDLEPDEWQHLADSYLREGLWAAAREVYERVLRSDAASIWTVHNSAMANLELGDWVGATRALGRANPQMRSEAAWPAVADALLRKLFDQTIETGRRLYAEGQYDRGDEAVHAGVARALALLARNAPSDAGRTARSKILVVANKDDPVTLRYRVEAKTALAREVGTACSICFIDEVEILAADFDHVLAVLFIEVAATPAVLKTLAAARASGARAIYEANGPVFDPRAMPPAITTFAGLITPALHDDLRLHAALQRALASQCDIGIGSTCRTASKLAALSREQKAFVCPSVMLEKKSDSHGNRLPDTFLFLRSPRFLWLTQEPGSVGAAFLKLLATKRIGIVLSGHVKLSEAFNAFDDGIVELGPASDPTSYDFALAKASLNIAPEAIPEDDGLVEVSWLEAASHGVATVMSEGTARALGLFGTRACLVSEPAELYQRVTREIRDRSATAIGQIARDRARAARSDGSASRAFARAIGVVCDESGG